MKKIILTAAIALGSLSTFAQAQTTTSTTSKAATETVKQEAYTEVALEEVPEEVKTAFTKSYPTAVLDKAYVNAAKEYKLDVTIGDKKGNLFADGKGNWIKK